MGMRYLQDLNMQLHHYTYYYLCMRDHRYLTGIPCDTRRYRILRCFGKSVRSPLVRGKGIRSRLKEIELQLTGKQLNEVKK